MYRLVEQSESENTMSMDNCLYWQQQTSKSIPTKDITEVVYEWSMEEYQAFAESPVYAGDNLFARYIKRNASDIVDFLLLAKRNEDVRFHIHSRWYYPSMPTPGDMSLEQIVEVALSRSEGRLGERYLLQAVRALFTLGRYDEVIALWDRVESLPADNIMRQYIASYVAGALYRTSRSMEALDYYAKAVDIGSLKYIAKRENIRMGAAEIISIVYRNYSSTTYIRNALERTICYTEEDLNRFGEYSAYIGDDELRRVCVVATELAREADIKDRAMWYYTAAYLYAMEQNFGEAQRLLRLAKQYPTTKTIANSIRLLDLALYARTAKLDSIFERHLVEELKWLDRMCAAYESTSDEFWERAHNRLFFEILVPRFHSEGKHLRALQLANYGYYRFMPEDKDIWYGSYKSADMCGYGSCSTYTVKDMRESSYLFNEVDYKNQFFVLINKSTPEQTRAFVERVERPQDALDRFVCEKGYVNLSYLYDILGTQLLRQMRYTEARDAFAKVGYGYKLNVVLNYDPFSVKSVSLPNAVNNNDFRYQFAREMAALAEDMERISDPNRRAPIAMRYAIGILNSFNRCWALTQYYRGCCGEGLYYEEQWMDGELMREAMTRAHSLIAEVLFEVTDDELAAELHYELGNYRTIYERYYSTERADFVCGHCDVFIDYNMHLQRY